VKESEIQKQIMRYLKNVRNGFFYRSNNIGVPLHSGGGFRPSPVKGLADIIGCLYGRFVAIEVKTKKGKVSQNQVEFCKSVQSSGGVYIVARDLQTVQDMIEHLEGMELKKDNDQMEF